MTHLHKASGLKFECGELMDFRSNGIRKTYDITVIMLWPRNDDEHPIVVDYYFGDYHAATTDVYIDRWLRTIGDCRDIVDAYWLTNKEFLVDTDHEKVERTLDIFNDVMEVLNNEKH